VLDKQANVFDFAKLAKAKLDPLAWDYLDEGSDDEASLHANRSRFDDIIIRPHFLINDVSTVDTSTTLFGTQLTKPIYISSLVRTHSFMTVRQKALAAAIGFMCGLLSAADG